MTIHSRLGAAAVLTASLLASAAPATAGDDKTKAKPISKTGIQWFATWEQAKAEAQRTQRPILFTSAAPHCRNISGMW